MTMIGGIEVYKPGEDFTAYIERMEQYFVVNDVKDEKKVPMLITLIGPEAYSVLKNLVSPEIPSKKKYSELVDVLKAHYVSKKSAIAERYNFYKMKQKDGQSINDYVVEIKRSAALCNFRNFLEEALRDKLACGLANEVVVKKLLSEGDQLKFSQAYQLAAAWECAEIDTKKNTMKVLASLPVIKINLK